MNSKSGQKRFFPGSKPGKELKMKTVKTIKGLLILCVGMFCIHGCAATNAYTPADQAGSGFYYDYSAEEATYGDATLEEEGLGKKLTASAVLGYVVAPYMVANAVVAVHSGLGMIGGAVNNTVAKYRHRNEVGTFADAQH
jgi:hypothetical protein